MAAMSDDHLLDARGVKIEPGDVVIYGFGVDRSVAMCEGVVVAEEGGVSLTASGRVRIRVMRRSFASGKKPIVDVAPDRIVVLKPNPGSGDLLPYLPPSPLPTQDEKARQAAERLIASYTADLRLTELPPDRPWWDSLEELHANAVRQLKVQRRRLRAIDGV